VSALEKLPFLLRILVKVPPLGLMFLPKVSDRLPFRRLLDFMTVLLF
jgi:hypothetical protein